MSTSTEDEAATEAAAVLEATAHADVLEEATVPAPRAKRRHRAGDYFPTFIVFLVFLGLWYAYHYYLPSYKRFIIPLPHDVLLHGFTERDNPQNPASLIQGVLITGRVALQGLVIAIILGMFIAVLMSQAKWIENAAYPYAVAIQAIPILAIVPVLRTLVRSGPDGSHRRVRDDLDLPDHHQHALRVEIGRRRCNTTCSRCTAPDGGRGCGSCSSPLASQRSSRASASPPGSRSWAPSSASSSSVAPCDRVASAS